jgi:glycine cleavage system aminomethyltransferase T
VSAGAKIVSGDREIGRVTSAVFSPAEDASIGLGYVHRDFTRPDTQLAIVEGDARVDARVTRLV